MRKFTFTTTCLLLACGNSIEVESGPTTGESSQAIASVVGGVEAAIDAPWRLEPGPSGGYGAIPIVVSIHDTSMQVDPGSALSLDKICEVMIEEEAPSGLQLTTIAAADIAEIERSDKWPYNSDVAANHRLCRHWAGENCANELKVGGSAEWHATVFYTPKNLTPGGNVRLRVQARVGKTSADCNVHPSYVAKNLPIDRPKLITSFNGYLLANQLSVHLGEAPLPRFDETGWVYGDLHYHSQGTDNEGESAYAYRPTLQAMRAIGLDFAFATDHASDSGQTTDIDEIFVDNIEIPYVPERVENVIEGLIEDYAIGIETSFDAARDMNPQRFAAMRAWLNDGSGAANRQAMLVPGGPRAPRLFLGGEVDVIPETGEFNGHASVINYGAGTYYNWADACTQVPDMLHDMVETTTAVICDSLYDLAEETSEGGRYMIKDIQGPGDQYFARQHVLSLPRDGSKDSSFVTSRTTLFGGAYRRLKTVLNEDFEIDQKGYMFLAHPADSPSGSGLGRLGPDILPYSKEQLKTAFDSKYVLGLQAWNSDDRMRTKPGNTGHCAPVGIGYQRAFPFNMSPIAPCDPWSWGEWGGKNPEAYRKMLDGFAMWDQMLLWGIRRSQTESLSWLSANRPRRVFFAGGSDAHGDWNYRREGSIDGVGAIVDTALGKPRNLVFVGPGRDESALDSAGVAHGQLGQEQVTDALASGQFSVTDGPALRVAIDVNGNGLIDDSDVPMGGVSRLTNPNQLVPVIVEWKSTDEFGGVASVDLYVGAANQTNDVAVTYAAQGHGVHAPQGPQAVPTPDPYVDAAGDEHVALKDGYMKDTTGKLHFAVSTADAKAGRKVVYLKMSDFPVGQRRKQEFLEECEDNPICETPGHTGNGGECEFPPVCTQQPTEYHYDNVSTPDRLVVHAFARTVRKGGTACDSTADTAAKFDGSCIERLAFTNPVWVGDFSAPTPVGGACSNDMSCVCGSYCNDATAKCAPTLALGAKCSETPACGDDAYCSDKTKSCVARPGVGAACAVSTPCQLGLSCKTGVCSVGGIDKPLCTQP